MTLKLHWTRPTLVPAHVHLFSSAFGMGRRKTPTHTVPETSHSLNAVVPIESKDNQMRVEKSLSTKPSEPDKVDAYMKSLKHPLAGVAKALREIILKTDPEIGEEIKWNAPAFFYTGELPPFNPKEYKRHIVVFNFYKQGCIRLVFPRGARVKDKSGLLEGDYPDGRRLALFYDMREVESRKAILQRLVKQWLVTLDKG